jgi:hypothetical protein
MTSQTTLPARALVAVAGYATATASYDAKFAAQAAADGDLDVARKAAAMATAELAAFEQLIAQVTAQPSIRR